MTGHAEFPAREAVKAFSDLLNRAGFMNERIVISRNGRPVAALVSLHDLALLARTGPAAAAPAASGKSP